MESKEDLDIMTRVKSYLDAIPRQFQNEEYCEISRRVDEYVIKYCKHDVVCDSIDIDVECSRTIYYCDKCLKTFSIEEIYKDIVKEVNYIKNDADLFLFYNETLMKILHVNMASSNIKFNCSFEQDGVLNYKTISLGINELAGCRFEGNVLWLAKQKSNENV